MSRDHERIKKKLEDNPVLECNKVQKRFYPNLFRKFSTNKVMLGTMYYKGIAGITSMQAMTTEFNVEAVVESLTKFMDKSLNGYFPHHVTENEYLARLDPLESQNQCKLFRESQQSRN